MATQCIVNGTLITPHGYVEDKLWIEDSHIKQIGSIIGSKDLQVIDAKNCYITPGLVDIHVHGGVGCNFLQSNNHDIEKLRYDLIKHGVTSIYPTIMTAPLNQMIDSISFLTEYIQKQSQDLPELMGINLEGPFLSPGQSGIHTIKDLRKLDLAILKQLLTNKVKIVTLAPELDKSKEIISFLNSKNILISMGHSTASYEVAIKSFKEGVKLVTHLFNAMKPMHHRNPGLVAAALNEKELCVELIADGIHVSPEVIRLALNLKDPDRVILISDAIALRGSPELDYCVGEEKIHLQDNKAVNSKGVISGSVLPLDQSIRNLVQWEITDFKTAINYATYNPAKLLSVSDKVGCLFPGTKANIVLWDKETLSIKSVFINGKLYDVSN